MKYDINLKNGDYFTVEVGDEDEAPTLLVEDSIFYVANMPVGWSVDPAQVLYIEPSEDD